MILAIETAGHAGSSVALLDNGGALIEQIAFRDARAVAAELAPAIARLAANHGCPGDAMTVAADCGPGSFTGIRIGIATAMGLADAWKARAIGVPHFALYDLPVPPCAVVIDSHAGGFYCLIRIANCPDRIEFVPSARLAAVLAESSPCGAVVLGDASASAIDGSGWRSVDCLVLPDAVAVGRAALNLVASGSAAPLVPLYVHPGFFAKSPQ